MEEVTTILDSLPYELVLPIVKTALLNLTTSQFCLLFQITPSGAFGDLLLSIICESTLQVDQDDGVSLVCKSHSMKPFLTHDIFYLNELVDYLCLKNSKFAKISLINIKDSFVIIVEHSCLGKLIDRSLFNEFDVIISELPDLSPHSFYLSKTTSLSISRPTSNFGKLLDMTESLCELAVGLYDHSDSMIRRVNHLIDWIRDDQQRNSSVPKNKMLKVFTELTDETVNVTQVQKLFEFLTTFSSTLDFELNIGYLSPSRITDRLCGPSPVLILHIVLFDTIIGSEDPRKLFECLQSMNSLNYLKLRWSSSTCPYECKLRNKSVRTVVLESLPYEVDHRLDELPNLSEVRVMESSLDETFFDSLPPTVEGLELTFCHILGDKFCFPKSLIWFELVASPFAHKLPLFSNSSDLLCLSRVTVDAFMFNFSINDMKLVNAVQGFLDTVPSGITELKVHFVPFETNLTNYVSYINALHLNQFELLKKAVIAYKNNTIGSFDMSIVPLSVISLTLDFSSEKFSQLLPSNLNYLHINLVSFEDKFDSFWQNFIIPLQKLKKFSCKIKPSSQIDLQNLVHSTLEEFSLVFTKIDPKLHKTSNILLDQLPENIKSINFLYDNDLSKHSQHTTTLHATGALAGTLVSYLQMFSLDPIDRFRWSTRG
ncbi:unnamed protein product [Ambrosiozyma monospora]|uniref:Unnamed protein product n=1 Tax=Ambrosiozyma monospora TaxID=43982 RepID=A0ACB5STQ9_AMBMO|nr:unnamed protein product [Ambrosiozyma monospora]